MLYIEAGEKVLTWKLWQRVSGETQGRLLGFWSWGNQGLEVHYAPNQKDISTDYEAV